MNITTFKRAVATEDRFWIAKGVREFKASGLTDREVFRLALAVFSDLDFGLWTDTVKVALQRHPAKFGRDARVELHPGCDAWMQGDRFGNVRSHKDGIVKVKMDSGRTILLPEYRVQHVVF